MNEASTVTQLLRILHNDRPHMTQPKTLDEAILVHYGNERDLTYSTMRRIATQMGLTNPELVHDLYESVAHHTNDWPEDEGFGTSDYNAVFRAYEIHYLSGFKPGETVLETGQCCYKGYSGVTYISENEGPSKGKTCVRWSDGMGTSITHGTRRPIDVGIKLGWFSKKGLATGGSYRYRTPKGEEVEVTCIGEKPSWDDVICVGPITEYVSRCRQATAPQIRKENLR